MIPSGPKKDSQLSSNIRRTVLVCCVVIICVSLYYIKDLYSAAPIVQFEQVTHPSSSKTTAQSSEELFDNQIFKNPFGSFSSEIQLFRKNKSLKDRFYIFFLHIPKTGGVTFFNILHQAFQKQFSNRVPYRLDIAWMPNGKTMDLWKNKTELKQLLNKYDSLMGHTDCGIELFINRPTLTLTMLREPISRYISEFYYITRNKFSKYDCKVKLVTEGYLKLDPYCKEILPEEPFPVNFSKGWLQDPAGYHLKLNKKQIVEMLSIQSKFGGIYNNKLFPNSTIEDYLNLSKEFYQDNYMVRAFTGVSWPPAVDAPFEFSDTALSKFRQAKLYLQEIPFFGLTERYRETLELLVNTFALNYQLPEEVPKVNKGFHSTPFSDEIVEEIKSISQWDIKLYEFALRLFDERQKWIRNFLNQTDITSQQHTQ